MIIVCNFQPVERKNYLIGVEKDGVYSEVFSTEYEEFGGKGSKMKENIVSTSNPMHGQKFSINLDIAPMSVSFIKFLKNKK